MVDRFLVLLLLLALAAWLTRAHFEGIDDVFAVEKAALHESTLRGDAPDPYQYKLWPISHAMEGVRHATGLPLAIIFALNTGLSLLALVFAHHAWLRTWAPPTGALVGALTLGALSSILFLNYAHHPYEFWGVALYCVLLLAIQRDAPLGLLVLLGLVTGLVWEKHAVLPFLWGLWSLQRGRPFLRTLLGGLLFMAACLAVPIAIRVVLGDARPDVDGTTTWDVQPWGRVAWTQLPFVLPFLAILVLRWGSMPMWIRWLWLAAPLAYAAYASQAFLLHEVRSFWLLAPVFTATLVCWLAGPPTPVPPATQVPVPRGLHPPGEGEDPGVAVG